MRGRRLLVASIVALAFVVAPGMGAPAGAHPLGNATINHYAGLAVGPDAVTIDLVLDLAEIPSFQERNLADTAPQQRCEALMDDLSLTLDDVALGLVVEQADVTLRPGDGDLPITRIECVLRAEYETDDSVRTLEFEDRNYADRLGWREISVVGESVNVATEPPVPASSISDRLDSYPADASILDQRIVSISVGGDVGAAPIGNDDAASVGGASDELARESGDDRFVNLIARGDEGAVALLITLLVAAGLGALHGLAPGHGKTVIAAYLVASSGTRRQAAGLATAVAASHTLGVFVLGAITVAASSQFAPERVYPYLQAASGAIVACLGAWLLVRAAMSRRHTHAADDHVHDHADHDHVHPDHDHDHAERGIDRQPSLALAGVGARVTDHAHGHAGHDHGHGHGHDHHDHGHHDHGHHDNGDHAHDHGDHAHGGHAHATRHQPEVSSRRERFHTHGLLPHYHGNRLSSLDPSSGPLSWKALVALGLSGGLVPSTSAVIVLLAAVQLERLFLGGVLILAFGVGMAVALVGAGFGLLAVSRRAASALDVSAFGHRVTAVVTPVAGTVVFGVGLFLFTRAVLTI